MSGGDALFVQTPLELSWSTKVELQEVTIPTVVVELTISVYQKIHNIIHNTRVVLGMLVFSMDPSIKYLAVSQMWRKLMMMYLVPCVLLMLE